MRVIACAAIAAGIVSCAATSRVPARKVAEGEFGGANAPYFYHAEGIKAYVADRDSTGGLFYFGKAIEADSTYAPAYYGMAEILLGQGSHVSAADYSRAANALDTANLVYRNQLGRALVMAGRYDEAMSIYTRLMREEPDNPVNYRLLAALYDFNGQPFTAISILDTAEMRLGRMEDLAMYKRELLIRVRLYDKALEEARMLVAEYPYDDGNYRILGDIYAAMGRDSLALVNYLEAQRLDSGSVITQLSLAGFYRRQGDNGGYFRALERVFASDDMTLQGKLDILSDVTSDVRFYGANYFAVNSLISILMAKYPYDYSVMSSYATHLVRGGNVEQALGFYKSYIALHPLQREAYSWITSMESYLGHPDSVLKYSDMALKLFPDDLGIMLERGVVELGMGDYRAAVKTLRRAYRSSSGDSVRSVVSGMIGDAYHEMGRLAMAYSSYERALRLDSLNTGTLNNYAYFLCEEGRELERALAMSRRANGIVRDNPTYLDTEGWILYRLGRYDEAREVMQRAVSFDATSNSDLLFHYAEIWYALGDRFMAELYWERARDAGYDAAVIDRRLAESEAGRQKTDNE